MSRNFFGGSPATVLMRLVVLSLILGVSLSALNISPLNIVNELYRLFLRIYSLGFESIEWLFGYFLLGAVIVFPVWLIVRLMKVGWRRS